MKRGRRAGRFLKVSLAGLSGMLIWAAHFGGVYVFQHIACATGTAPSIVRTGIGAMTLLAAGGIGACWRACSSEKAQPRRSTPEFHDFQKTLTRALLGLGLFGILATGVAASMLPACQSMR